MCLPMLTIDKVKLFEHVLEQHANEAAFLWMQRSQAMRQVGHSLGAISKLELRINNHLKGLFIAPKHAWDITLELAESQQSSELFVLTMLAIYSGESKKIHAALQLSQENPGALKGVISALGWLPNDKIYPLLEPWIKHQNTHYRHLAIAACRARRLDPLHHLDKLFNDAASKDNIPLYCQMLRLVGELKRFDLALQLKTAQAHDNADVRFWASRSDVLLGNTGALAKIEPYIFHTNTHQLKAIDIAFRCLPQHRVWDYINKLVSAPQQTTQAIIALSTLGDPHGLNWLLARMAEPAYAKVAGHAFSQITGVDLLHENLASYSSSNFDDDDDDYNEVASSEGFQNLPTPQIEKVTHRWQQIRHHFHAGNRYFLGQPITSQLLQKTLLDGLQAHRLFAATELALLNKNNIYPNVKATLNQPEPL